MLDGSVPRRASHAALLEEEPRASVRALQQYPARIASVAVCDRGPSVSQDEALELLGLADDEFAQGIFERCGVERRYLDLEGELIQSTLQGRTAHVERRLLERSTAAVDALGVDPEQIGTVVSASLYSLGCPTLAHRLVDHYEMDPVTDKYHLTGVGCASGVPLMRLAAQAMAHHPGKDALVVAAESMSGILTPAAPGDARAKIVGAAIFGDGCAAAVLRADAQRAGPAIVDSQVHQVGDSLGAVSLSCDAHESYLHLDRDLPDLAAAGVPAVVDGFLQRNAVERADVDHWVVHPGGRRIIESVQFALGLADEDIESSRRSLADHGNVGTPSILYVLDDTIAQRSPQPGELGLMLTIGPGVTLGLMLLAW